MVGRAATIAVFCASVYLDIWSMIDPNTADWLVVAFFFAFISADSPWVTYSKNVEIKKTGENK